MVRAAVGSVNSPEQGDLGPRPTHCPACGRIGTLVEHGRRPRKVWSLTAAFALVLVIRRLRCGRSGSAPARACGKTITLLPGFLYPYRRYPLEVIQLVLMLRFQDARCWRSITVEVRVAETTAQEWCKAFSAPAKLWLTRLLHWFSHSLGFVTPDDVVRSPEAGLLSTAGLCMDQLEQTRAAKPLAEHQILQRLWEWGFERLNSIHLLSTRFTQGRPALGRPRSREPT
jgi:hypothetical protein